MGGRLAHYMVERGHFVTLGTRKQRKTPDWLVNGRVAIADWEDGCSLEDMCRGIDVLIHSAGMNASDCEADPIAALEFSGLATSRLIEAAHIVGVRRFIYLSTAHVYSRRLVGMISENKAPQNTHPYASSNLAAENVVLYANELGKMEGYILRLSNVIGAPMDLGANCWSLVVNDLCRQVVSKGEMVLDSTGLQQRDFLAMRSLCSTVDAFCSKSSDVLEQGLYNVGSEKSMSVFEVAQLIQRRCKRMLGFSPSIKRQQAKSELVSASLRYSCQKVEDAGIYIESSLDREVDELLAFSKATFI